MSNPTPEQTELATRLVREIDKYLNEKHRFWIGELNYPEVAAIVARYLPAQPDITAKQNEVAATTAFEACKAALESGNNYSPLQVAACTAAAVRQLMENISLAPQPKDVWSEAIRLLDAQLDSIIHPGDFPRANELRMLRRQFETARDAAPPLPVQWQPIESAPSGSVSVLLGSAECEIVEIGYADFRDSLCTEGHEPTHWQLLPAPPETKEAKVGNV